MIGPGDLWASVGGKADIAPERPRDPNALLLAMDRPRERVDSISTAQKLPENRTTVTVIPHDLSREFTQALREILAPNKEGEVRFGAQNEELRLSQIEALTAVQNFSELNGRIGHIVQPGGTGKTREGIVAAYAMHKHGRNTLYVVPSQQAVHDFSDKARKLCPDLEVGTVYQVKKCIGRLTFITYASLLRCILGKTVEVEAQEFVKQERDARKIEASVKGRSVTIDPREYDLVIWDEAHKYLTAHAQELIARFTHAISIALTATPRYYEGKEVAHVFGNRLHELDLQTAIRRKEISDFRNLLITTDVTTGLELSSPDQEESAKVAKAIDIPGRNRIFPDMYRNAKIRVGEKEFTLTGEPTIVFGVSINHVHDLAQAFNDTLTKDLHNNEEFRAALRVKGIDPDQVEQIAAPIHSDGTEEYLPMPLAARNKLVERCHKRKVLVLVATSVLQQSFDSPITSVVIDSVPRQTYVGVGQAGMRALRYLTQKEMVFIINTQDADHPSLTFLDFQEARGREEGVAVEIKGTNVTGNRPTRTEDKEATASYNVTYGAALVDLAQRNKTQGEQLYRDEVKNSSQYFTALGFQRVNKLIIDIASGRHEAVEEFVEVIQPWIDKKCQQIESQIFIETDRDAQDLKDAVTDTLCSLLATVQSGKIGGWHRFVAQFYSDLRHRYTKIQRGYQEQARVVSLNEDIYYQHIPSHLSAIDPRELVYMKVPRHQTLSSSDSLEENPDINYLNELRGAIESVLKTLPIRDADILKLYYGIDKDRTHTFEEIGQQYGLWRQSINLSVKRSISRLRHPEHSRQLKEYR